MFHAKLPYHYYIVCKSDGNCFQYINTNRPDYALDNETDYSISLDGKYNILGCYYIDKKWYRKVWREVGENGDPVEGSTFEMVEFIPELVEG